MPETSTSATPTKKPASRAKHSGGAKTKRPHRKQPAAANKDTAPAAQANGHQTDWNGFNHIVSRYLGKHENASISETTLGEVMSWGQAQARQKPKVMAAAAGTA
jgi:hypothetical protein